MKQATKNLMILIVSVFFLGLTACHDDRLDYIYDGYGYYGDDLAGRSYEVASVELGIGSGVFVDVNPAHLNISFDFLSYHISGNLNCNSFTADVNWYEFGLDFSFFIQEDYLCEPVLGEFPEDISLRGSFEIEIDFEAGRQVLILYSEFQDVAIYLYER